jgi:dihydrofolate synthase/folylpolyglutamate synthase
MSIRPSYKEAIQYLYDIEKYGMDLGLKRVKALLKSLDNPQDKFPIIHVAGTNGKGSTSAMIASILVEAGYKAGLYTSPHLVRFNERIRINHREISDKKVAELVERIRCRSQESEVRSQQNSKLSSPTFFEFTTAMAFLYFAEEKVDIAVMEVGLGGRLDATNVGKPLVSVITNIAKDHQAILGSRIKDIAFEKAGIIKKGGILISGETKPAALKVLISECKRKKAVFYRLDRDFSVGEKKRRNGETEKRRNLLPDSPIPRFPDSFMSHSSPFTFTGRRWFYQDLAVNLLGRHQYLNAASALAALEVLEERGFYLTESCIRKGLRNVLWPGRIEIVSKRPLVVLDCAHNPAGAKVLKDALTTILFEARKMMGRKLFKETKKRRNRETTLRFPDSPTPRLFLVLGIMADKDIKGIVSKLVPLASMIILTRPKTERVASLETLYREIRPYLQRRGEAEKRRNGEKYSPTPRLPDSPIHSRNVMLIEDAADACKTAISMANADDIICISGSIFTVGEAREAFRQLQIGNCKLQNVKLENVKLEKGKP